jgi:alkanesulfonate monooxygenase SsuD/methylene tetrahydromethanopterin reductase-like flavin-dependent oxidoreductase (luciferase family)
LGGHTEAAYRRAACHAGGWYGYLLDHAATARHVEGLRSALAAAGRERSGFELTVTPAMTLDRDAVRAFAELGVDRLVLVPGPSWRSMSSRTGSARARRRSSAPRRATKPRPAGRATEKKPGSTSPSITPTGRSCVP